MSSQPIILTNKERIFKGTIQLTGSKSESNRALILQALSKGIVQAENLSSAADTVTLKKILEGLPDKAGVQQGSSVLDVGPAGTAMRFLAAYAAVKGLQITLTGTERMKQRPIGILVDALRELGGGISYEENEGFPPVRVHGPFLQKQRTIRIKGSVSSQYITALLLVAPVLPDGLTLEIEGGLTSRPYVEMTLAMMSQAGIEHQWNGNLITIPGQPFRNTVIAVEPDWSAASYWYSIAALCSEAAITLPYLKKESIQGDSRIASIMSDLGIETFYTQTGIILTKTGKKLAKTHFDFKECPDLAQTVIVCCAALGYNATFTGLETLKIKETDRVKALQNELAKINVTLTGDKEIYTLDSSKKLLPEKIRISTYEDHRMAMAFAPLALVVPEVEIEDPAVVDKSYPHFWEDLQKAGFKIN